MRTPGTRLGRSIARRCRRGGTRWPEGPRALLGHSLPKRCGSAEQSMRSGWCRPALWLSAEAIPHSLVDVDEPVVDAPPVGTRPGCLVGMPRFELGVEFEAPGP